MNNYTKEQIEHFEAALLAVPYVSAIMQGDEEGLISISKTEDASQQEIAMGALSLSCVLMEVIAGLIEADSKEAIFDVTTFLNDAIQESNEGL